MSMPPASAAQMKRLAALPGVERLARHRQEPLGRQERVTFAQVDRSPADFCSEPSTKEESVEVGVLDARLRRPGGACAKRQLRAERDGSIGIGLHDDRARRGQRLRGAVVVHRCARERLIQRADLEIHHARRRPATEHRRDRAARALDDLTEGDRSVQHRHLRLASGAIDAEGRGGAEPLDAQLPGVIVEADDRFAARPARQLDERGREIAQDASGLPIGHARRDVGAVEEDVEHLARGQPPSRGVREGPYGARIGIETVRAD